MSAGADRDAEITAEEASRLLETLRRHFKQPVMPVGVYCAHLESWDRAISARALTTRAALYPGIDYTGEDEVLKQEAEQALSIYKVERDVGDRIATITAAGGKPTDRDWAIAQLREYEGRAEDVSGVFLQIRKSNLLARLIYGGQQVRTRPCPVHKGHWSGCAWEKLACGCLDGCNITGWLPNEDDQAAREPAPGGPVPVVIDEKRGIVDLAPSMKPPSWAVAMRGTHHAVPELTGLTEERARALASGLSSYEGQFQAIDLGDVPSANVPSAIERAAANLAPPPPASESIPMTQPTDPVHAHPAQPAQQAVQPPTPTHPHMAKKVFVSGEEAQRPKPMRRTVAYESPTTTRAFSTEPQVSPDTSRAEDIPSPQAAEGIQGAQNAPAEASGAAPAPGEGAATAPAAPAPGPASASTSTSTPPMKRMVFQSPEHKRSEVPQPSGRSTPQAGTGSPLQNARPIQSQSIIRDAKPITNRELGLRYDAEGVEPNGVRDISRESGLDLQLTRVMVPGSMAPNGQSLYRIESVKVEGREAMRPSFREAGGIPSADLVDASSEQSAKFFDLGVCHTGKAVAITVRRLSETPVPFQGAVMGTRLLAPASAPAPAPAAASSPQAAPPAPPAAPAPATGAAPASPPATEPA
jgi:hypothetical protein